jgi:hypothetical protein
MNGGVVRAVEDVLLQGRTCSIHRRPTMEGPEGCGASIGMHYRLCSSTFSVCEGMESGRVDYDERRRSSELEGSVDEAIRLRTI